MPTLLSLAEKIKQEVKNSDSFFMPVMDARRMDVYTAIYDGSENELLKTTCATINDDFEKSISSFGEIYIGGNALNKCKETFSIGKIRFVEGIDCDSRWLVNIAESKYNRGEFEYTAYFEPNYLKEFLPKTGKQ